jgi:hypothetical protein
MAVIISRSATIATITTAMEHGLGALDSRGTFAIRHR